MICYLTTTYKLHFSSSGVNCSVNVLDYLDEACSWKSECNYNLGYLLNADSCLELIRPYLKAQYDCISGKINMFYVLRNNSVDILARYGVMDVDSQQKFHN